LDHPEEARRWLAKAREWADLLPTLMSVGDQGMLKYTVWSRAEFQVLLREAESLIEPK